MKKRKPNGRRKAVRRGKRGGAGIVRSEVRKSCAKRRKGVRADGKRDRGGGGNGRKSGCHPEHLGQGHGARGGKKTAKTPAVPPPLPAQPQDGGGNGGAAAKKPWRALTAMKKRPGRRLVFYLDVVPAPAHKNDPERWAAMVSVVVGSLVASVAPNPCQFEKKSGVSRQMTGQMLRENACRDSPPSRR